MKATSIFTLLAVGVLAGSGCGGAKGPGGDLDGGGDGTDGLSSGDGPISTGDGGTTGDGGGTPSMPLETNPVTQPQAGSHMTYNVGPGQTYLEPDTVPWGALVAGDVVNIFARPAPYAWKLCLRGSGTASAPIVINGVTDASGNRPHFDFKGARTASGCNPGGTNNVFDPASQDSLEDYAGILIRPGVDDAFGYKPSFIQIKNLELSGAADGNSFVSISGATVPYATGSAIWLQVGADILIENDVIYDNGNGIFTMAKDGSLQAACERVTVRSNRVYGNGVAGSYLEHNLYIQTTNPIIEGNYFGITRAGSQGSTYKSRSAGEIFRYNYVEASARAIDWVHSEDQTPGIATQADYGTDYAYGNIIVNDCTLANCATNPIHYGGDNLGEQGTDVAPFVPTTPYRAHLYFYNNTVVNRVDSGQSYRVSVFDPSLTTTTIEAWNNIFSFFGSANFSWVNHAGNLKLRGSNLSFGASVDDASSQAIAGNYSVAKLGTMIGQDPSYVAAASSDFRLQSGSPAIDLSTDVPAGITPSASYLQVPVPLSPFLKANGMQLRTVKGMALDLGALESGL